MRELNINLRPDENLYVTTYEDGEVEYIPSTPEDNEREETRLKNLGVKFTTEIRNDLIKYMLPFLFSISTISTTVGCLLPMLIWGSPPPKDILGLYNLHQSSE